MGPGNQQLPACPQVIDTIFQELKALGDDTQSLQTVSLVQVGQEQGRMSWDEGPIPSLPLPGPCCAKGTYCPVLASSPLIQRVTGTGDLWIPGVLTSFQDFPDVGSLSCPQSISQAPAARWEQGSPLTPSCSHHSWAFPVSHCSLWPEGPSSVALIGTGVMPAPATGLGPALWLWDAARDLISSTQGSSVPRALPFPGARAGKAVSYSKISLSQPSPVHGHKKSGLLVSVGCQQPPLPAPLPNAAPSFQISTHDKAWDLLRPDGRALQVMDVAPLGL